MMQRRKKIQKQKRKNSDSKKPFVEHLQELRNRIGIWFISFILFSVIGYLLRETISEIILKPLNQTLYFSSPAGGFNYIFSISLFFGFLMSLPVLVYEILLFIEPVLPEKIKNSSIKILFSSFGLMITGILFSYFIVLPKALTFLINFGGENVQSLISTDEYFSFVTKYILGFGILFQLPLVMIFVNKVHKLNMKELWKLERWVVLVSFVLAAVLTPTPDIVNQLIMAVPVILLYQISILIVWFTNKRY
jgi:sec-independent protein translocase protein TatC